jgi:glycosyltransferase involved in cell wall biosynthesis
VKVLYIGHYKDGTGWGNAAVNNILAMNSVGIEVVPRAITYEQNDAKVEPSILELEGKKNTGCDVVIQHTLPHNYVYNGKYKNIGFLAVETTNFTQRWVRNCNLMDEIWVPSETTKQIAIESAVGVPVKVVPHSLDLSEYANIPKGMPIDTLVSSFTFGFVGEFIERKNLKALVQAYHMTFDPREPVSLFIKTSKRDLESIQKYLEHIRSGLKIRNRYKEEVIVTGMPKRQEYLSLLNQIDCFVMPSRGEAFCIPSLELGAMGVPSIWTDGIGMDHCYGTAVPSTLQTCFGAVESPPYLDTAYSRWREIDVVKLCSSMRGMYDMLSNSEMKQGIAEQCIEKSNRYSHQAVGQLIKEILNDV